MADFYKFKADVYSYLDGKYEHLSNTFAKKFQSVFEFMGQTEEKLRVINDIKGENDFRYEDFKTKYQQKQKILEDSVSQCTYKQTLFEGKLKDYQGYLVRLKKLV